MNPQTTTKLILAAAGLAVFFTGVRADSSAVRWTGIALVAAAWLVRFVFRRDPAPAKQHDPPD